MHAQKLISLSLPGWDPFLQQSPRAGVPPAYKAPVMSLPEPPEQPKGGQPLRISPKFSCQASEGKRLWNQASADVHVHAGTGENQSQLCPLIHATGLHPAVHGHRPAMPQADMGWSTPHPEVTPGMPIR